MIMTEKVAPVVILTASFGEGHNSAARNVAAALGELGVGVEVYDPVGLASPVLAGMSAKLYGEVTTKFPAGWEWFFEVTRGGPFGPVWWDRLVGVGTWLEAMLRERRPRAVVSTFRLYPHFLGELGRRVGWSGGVWTVVTDSLTIHPVWMSAGVTGWFVTDEFTAEVLACAGVDAGRVEVSGFPVPLVFGGLGRGGDRAVGGLRVLYLATTGRRHARETLGSLLRELPDGSELSVVMGRSAERLRGELGPMVERVGGRLRVELLGWCGDIPARMRWADVVVTKAGGATVHECLAAGVPAVVNYVIPGQEEGNVVLLERLGAGCRAPREASACGAFVRSLAESGRLVLMREAAQRHGRSDGAMVVARRILNSMELKHDPGVSL